MSLNHERLGTAYGPVRFAVDEERIGAYADATADPLTLYRGPNAIAPPVFGIVPAWPAVQQALADEELGVDVGRIVHGEQRMIFHRLIRARDELVTSGTLASITERGENEIFVLAFETRDAAGSPVTTQEVLCVSRGMAPPRPERTESRPAARSHDETPREPDLVRVVNLPADITFRYARASGDDNRIHVDEEFARTMGLPGIIVQGMCLFSISLQTLIEAASGRPDRIASASVRFRRPLRPGSAFETCAWIDGGETRFEGRRKNGQVVLSGSATVDPVN